MITISEVNVKHQRLWTKVRSNRDDLRVSEVMEFVSSILREVQSKTDKCSNKLHLEISSFPTLASNPKRCLQPRVAKC